MQYKQRQFSDGLKLFYAWFEAMHTRVDVLICSKFDDNSLIEFVKKLQTEIEKFERIGNRFAPDSEISYVNTEAYKSDIVLSNELFGILADCQLYNQKTSGYFDIAVNSSGQIKSKESYLLNFNNQTIRFANSGILLDLSGFLKGYVLERLVEISEKECYENILINLGNSSIFAKGNHPYGKGWKIEHSENNSDCILVNESLTTSGNDIRTKWPIVNPKDGLTVTNKKSVSVVTKSPAVGEVLSKVAYLATKNERDMIFEVFGARLVN